MAFVWFLFCINVCVSQTVENPVFDRTDTYVFHVDKIEEVKDLTYVFCSISVPDNSWINISPNTYIEDVATKDKYTILNSDGIPFYPSERSFDTAMKCEVKLTFPKLPNSKKVNLIEKEGGQGFNIYGIDLNHSFSKTFTTLDYEHLVKMTEFWVSSGNIEKALETKQKEWEASNYLFGIKSFLSLSKMYEISDMYAQLGSSEESSNYRNQYVSLCQNITNDIKANVELKGRNNYYLQDLDWFSEKQILALSYLHENKQWNEAKSLAKDVSEILKEKNDTSFYLPIIQYFMGISSFNAKDEDEAERYYVMAYHSFQTSPKAKQFPIYGELLSMMSALYNNWGMYDDAYHYAIESCELYLSLLGDKSKEYGFALAALSNAEMALNKKQEGLSHAELASQIIENAKDVSPEIKDLYKNRLVVIKNALSGSPNIYSDQQEEDNSTGNVAVVVFDATNDIISGDLDSAIEKLNQSKEYQENNFENIELHIYIRTIVTLSDALVQTGRLKDADITLDNSMDILRKHGVKTKLIRHLYASKGLLYYLLDDIDNSIGWYKKAVEMFRQVNDRSISYARLLGNISLLYSKVGSYDVAKEYLDEAFGICSDFYSNDFSKSNDHFVLLNNLATNYWKLGEREKGIEMYKSIILNAAAHDEKRIKALAMCNMAEIYILSNDFEKGRRVLEEAISLDVDGYIKDMIDSNMLFCLIMGKDGQAIERLREYNDYTKDRVAKVFSRFSELEREKYWTQWSRALVFLNNLAVSIFDTNETRQMAYDIALYAKSMLVNSGQLLGNIVKERKDKPSELYALMQQYKDSLSVKGLSQDTIDSYRRVISQIEKQVISSIPNFDEAIKSQFKSFKDVQNSLLDNEVAIEFIFLPQVTIPIEDSKMSYSALILTKQNDSPKLVSLCTEDDLEKILCLHDSTLQSDPNLLYSTTNRALYEKIWGNIEPFISNGAKVFYSPTGYLSRINLSAIYDGVQRLSEKYDFYEVSTTAIIGERMKTRDTNNGKIIIYGDVNYNEDTETMEQVAYSYKTYSPGTQLATRSISRGSWDLLPGTKDEIDSISNIVRSKVNSLQVYNMNNANEESFKALNRKSPDIIHIATHGFFYPGYSRGQIKYFNTLGNYTAGDRHMLYSGLLFAGANNAWLGKTIKEGVEDGILTADEISRIDLSNTNLVVLSACDTGLGDINKIDGVFGLQRGFKRAGVNSILMSLWKVDDEATKILMVEFYKNLMRGKTKHQSLKDAQRYLCHIDNGKYDNPEYWASFIMLDGFD